jgi:lysophospholipase L1-like esterase
VGVGGSNPLVPTNYLGPDQQFGVRAPQIVTKPLQQSSNCVDYFERLAGNQGGFKPALANDGLHPNRDGYATMRPLTYKVIARAAK